jgi:hypothetical protein
MSGTYHREHNIANHKPTHEENIQQSLVHCL